VQVVVLSGFGSSEGPNINYLWNGPSGGILGDSTQLNASVILPGTYTLLVVNEENGCPDTAFAEVTQDIEAPTVDLPEEAFLSCVTNTVVIEPLNVGMSSDYEYEWYTIGGNIVQVQSQVNATADAPGWYFLSVFNTGNGCESIDSVLVSYPNPPTGAIIDINGDCWGQSTGIIDVTTIFGGTGPFYFVLNGGPIPITSFGTFEGLPGGTYELLIQDANQCEWDTTLTVPVFEQVLVDLGPDVTLQLGEDYQLDALVSLTLGQIDWFSWNPAGWLSCTDCFDPFTFPLNTITYTFTVVDTNGCAAADTIQIFVDERPDVFIPNIFSPNGDGENDVFMIFAGPGVKRIKELKVFDRWGEKVFEINDFLPNDPYYGWDGVFRGDPMDPAVFVYYTVVELINGTEVLLEGGVTLIR
jgi:gliding motility-associated-like protein